MRCRSSFLITIVFMTITAVVLAEICSALPVSGSIYIWAAESAGPKYARFMGFIVAWWSCTAWMTFTAGNCQVRKFLLMPCSTRCTLFRRQLPTILCLNSLFGRLIFRVVSAIRTLSGERSSGLYRKDSFLSQLRLTIFPRDCIRRSLRSQLH